MEYRGFTTCRVGVHVSCLARRVQRTSRLYYAGQMSRQLNAPVRIAELAISGASVDASGRRHLTLPGGGTDSPYTWSGPVGARRDKAY